jgi:hypothetical protein
LRRGIFLKRCMYLEGEKPGWKTVKIDTFLEE